MNIKSRSLRFRLTIISILISAAALCGLTYLLNYAVTEHLYQQDEMQIQQELRSVSEVLTESNPLEKLKLQYTNQFFFMIQLSRNNQIIFTSNKQLKNLPTPTQKLVLINIQGVHFRGIVTNLKTDKLGGSH